LFSGIAVVSSHDSEFKFARLDEITNQYAVIAQLKRVGQGTIDYSPVKRFDAM
jgi:hypothetical protein